MKIREEFKVREMAGEHVIVLPGRGGAADMTRIVSLNPSSMYLWEKLRGREFTAADAALLLTEYLGSKPAQNEYKHFLATKIYVDYLWTLWAKTRVPYDGQPMEDWAVERYARLKDNLRLFAEA